MESTLLTALLVLSLLFLNAAVLFLVISYLKLTKKFATLQPPAHIDPARSLHKADQLLEEASQASLDLMKESSLKAQQMLKASSSLSDELHQNLHQLQKQLTQTHQQEYTSTFTATTQELKDTFAKLSHQLETQATQELQTLIENFSKKLLESAATLDSQITKDYQKAKQSTDEYATQLRSTLDQQTQQIVQQVLKKVIKKSLTTAEHEQLLLEAVDEAKQQFLK